MYLSEVCLVFFLSLMTEYSGTKFTTRRKFPLGFDSVVRSTLYWKVRNGWNYSNRSI